MSDSPFSPEQSVTWRCPSCGVTTTSHLPLTTISCTVRCTNCDCSIGLSGRDLKRTSIVYRPERATGVAWTAKKGDFNE